MSASFKARVNKLKSTKVSVSQKSEKSSLETPSSVSSSMTEDVLKSWLQSSNNINNAITRIESDVNSVKSDRDRVIRLEYEMENLMKLISNKEYFKNIFTEMLETMETDIDESEEEKIPEWKSYVDNELNIISKSIKNTHNQINEIMLKYENTDKRLQALKEDYILMVSDQKRHFNSLKDDINFLENFKTEQKKNILNINNLLEENFNFQEKLKKRIENVEKITKETSKTFVTKVSDLADVAVKIDGRVSKNENSSKELGNIVVNIKEMFEQEKSSLLKIISNLKDDFIELHERCDHTLKDAYRNESQTIIEKYIFELSQLNVLFESSKTMQRENNYLKCISGLSSRIDKIEKKIT